MSKLVKDLLSKAISHRLSDVENVVIGNMIGLSANDAVSLRKRFREKNIGVLVVKNSMARRATANTPLAPAFAELDGPAAVIWGGEDFVSLVKEVTEIDKSKEFDAFQAMGGVMEGEALSPEKVKEISKWPNREEQLSILSGQILSPGAELQAQLIGPASKLASQIKSKSEEDD